MTPHVHAKEIHAFAEGYEIECKPSCEGRWFDSISPTWHPNDQYRIKDPYRELKEAAKDPNKEIRCNGSDWYDGTCWAFNLPPEDYEIRDKHDPYAELKEAAKDPTKQIRLKGRDWYGDWYGVGEYALQPWAFNYPLECYEIRDKPKAKVKMWQWIYKHAGYVHMTFKFYAEAPEIKNAEIIRRAEWTMIEVEE